MRVYLLISAVLANPAFAGFCPNQLLIETQKVVAGSNSLIVGESRFRHFAMEPIVFGPGGQFRSMRYFPTRGPTPETAEVIRGFHARAQC